MNQVTYIKNDYRPELRGDDPTCLQYHKEFTVIFNRVLAGYKVPFQVRRFLHTIFVLTKPGKVYGLTDYDLAKHLGKGIDGIGSDVSRNYVSKLRRKYKDWCSERTELGVRKFRFVGITENKFDVRTKKQKPTEYTFNAEFAETLDDLIKQVRAHKVYRENWLAAIEAVVDNQNKLLGQYGVWDLRPQKRPRKTEDILGTYLLNLKRTTRKVLDFMTTIGHDRAETAAILKTMVAGYIDTAAADPLPLSSAMVKFTDEDGAIQKLIPVYGSTEELNKLFSLAIQYTQAKEARPETVLPVYRRKPILEAGQNESLRSSTQRNTFNADYGAGSGSADVPTIYDIGEYSGPGGEIPGSAIMDLERVRFMARVKTRAG